MVSLLIRARRRVRARRRWPATHGTRRLLARSPVDQGRRPGPAWVRRAASRRPRDNGFRRMALASGKACAGRVLVDRCRGDGRPSASRRRCPCKKRTHTPPPRGSLPDAAERARSTAAKKPTVSVSEPRCLPVVIPHPRPLGAAWTGLARPRVGLVVHFLHEIASPRMGTLTIPALGWTFLAGSPIVREYVF